MVSMGDAGVGKSCLIKRFCEQKFYSKYTSTIGVDFGVKKVEYAGTEIRVNLWDMAGGGEFREVRNELYQDAEGILLVFDVSSRRTFDSLPGWLDEGYKHGLPRCPILLIGNKVDYSSSATDRSVSSDEAKVFAERYGLWYLEASASTGEGVHAIFTTLIARMLASSPGATPQATNAVAADAASSLSSLGESRLSRSVSLGLLGPS